MPRKKPAPKPSKSRERSVQQTEHQSAARSRRYEAHKSVLTELRRIEKHMQPAIPRLPFQRVVRQITAENNIRFRWTPSALLCLQEAMEDWMIEFMEDAYFLSAHAHRLTIMPKDFNTLRIIRHRHEHLLEPILAGDKKMSDILTIPPLHPRRRAGSKASHDRNTRSQATRGNDDMQDPLIITEVPVESEVPPIQPDENTQQTGRRQRGRLDREARQRILLERLEARRLAVVHQEAVNQIALGDWMNVYGLRAAFNVAGNREVEPLSREDLGAFVSADNMMNDMSVKVVLWMVLSELDLSLQNQIVLLDPLISEYLRNPQMSHILICQSHSGFFLRLHGDSRFVILPYHQATHWSIALFDIQTCVCYYANSVGEFHGNIRMAVQKLVNCVELIVFEPELLTRLVNRRVRVSSQNDGVSCGWRACLNALLLLKSIVEIPDPLDISSYTDLELDEFRVQWAPKLVAAIQDRSSEEERMAPVWAQERLDAARRREEQNEAWVQDYNSARENFARSCQEVEEFIRAQRNAENSD